MASCVPSNIVSISLTNEGPDPKMIAIAYSRQANAKSVLIPKSVFRNVSSSFDRLLDSSFGEGPLSLNLTDTPDDAIKMFTLWLSNKTVADKAQFESTGEQPESEYQKLLCLSWAFAERYGVTELQNDVIDALMKSLEASDITLDVLQVGLEATNKRAHVTSKNTDVLRLALMHEAMCLKKTTGHDLLNKLNIKAITSYDQDLKVANAWFNKRMTRVPASESRTYHEPEIRQSAI